MRLDYSTLEALKHSHPAWRLLRADSASLIVSFLSRIFLQPNVRQLAASELESKLEDELFQLRAVHGEELYPQSARIYLDDWCKPEKGWLRKFYPPGLDEPHYDLTPATEKAVAWLESLVQRPFVATESRIHLVFQLLRQIVDGSETDAEVRIVELESRIAEIEKEIERVKRGHLDLLDDTALRDRYLQMSAIARELLGDFREVEDNFRRLDRESRELIARWDGTKGELLDEIFGERDAITDSDQGRSFRAFWSFLMSRQRQRELSELLEEVLTLPAIETLKPDRRMRKIHYDWLEAGETTQRTVSALSSQLRRFLDDKAWLENRRIVEVVKEIEKCAVELKNSPPEGVFAHIDSFAADIELPMERKLYQPSFEVRVDSSNLAIGDEEVDTESLFSQVFVDTELLTERVVSALSRKPQVTLGTLLEAHPLEQGLAELVTYFSLRAPEFEIEFDEKNFERVTWSDPEHGKRVAKIPRVTFVR